MEEESYEKKFALLEPWISQILNDVKKELKGEHLRQDMAFVQKYFAKKAIDKLTVEELTSAYIAEVKEGNQEVGEWVASRWVLKHADIYHFFSEKLSEINPKFDEIKEIPQEKAVRMMQLALSQFGAPSSYIFSVLNSVRFSDGHYAELREKALSEQSKLDEASALAAAETLVDLRERFEREMARLTDKYEKKLQGFQKKYSQDTDGLKKQIAALQRKLGEKSACSR